MWNVSHASSHLIVLVLASLVIGSLTFIVSVIFSIKGKNKLEDFLNETSFRRDRINLIVINYIAISAVADSFYFKFGNYLIGFGALVSLVYSSWMLGAKSNLSKHVIKDLESDGAKGRSKKENLLIEIEDCNGYGLEKRATKYGIHIQGLTNHEIREKLREYVEEKY